MKKIKIKGIILLQYSLFLKNIAKIMPQILFIYSTFGLWFQIGNILKTDFSTI